mmetsp:Transcript_20381/g.48635  ORF Transcript_20381/g.48635 Transcript_20381/m.48635 type:complete len:211 (+) Transcript_20381:349-981(+)
MLSSALASCFSYSPTASSSIAAGVVDPILKTSTVASGTRCRNSHCVPEMIRTPSSSAISESDCSYEYLTQSPYGPTISTILSQYKTTESVPHHTSWLGGTWLLVGNSERFLLKSVVMTQTKPSWVKHASIFPLGQTDIFLSGPAVSFWSSTPVMSTTRMVLSTASRTSSALERVNCGSMMAMHVGLLVTSTRRGIFRATGSSQLSTYTSR